MTAARAALSPADQRWVQVLGALLPAGFRDRQRGEWAADLLMLSPDPVARRRYLRGVARTLPSLRAAARGHESVVPATPGRRVAVTAWRVIASVLAWSVTGWLSAVLVPYLFVRYRDDASVLDGSGWTDGPVSVLLPIVAVLFWGGLATVLGPLLTGVTSVTVLVLAIAERRRSLRHRLCTVAAAAALSVVTAVQYNSDYHAYGDSLAVLALAALPLMTRRAGLSVRRRVVLGVLAGAAVAIAILYQTPFGHDLAVWLLD